MKNRNIQVLRAVAVLLVLIFHLDLGLLPAGFLGVDVFLVISGFLIAKSLDSGAVKYGLNTTTVLGFYSRRIDRIFPPLLVVTFLTVLAGLLVMSLVIAENLYMSGLAGLFGVSNLYFFFTTDYFSDSTIYKPLLHTWSLGLELQFYLLFPLVYLLIKKLSRGKYLALLGAMLLSLTLAEVASSQPRAVASLGSPSDWSLLSPHGSYYLLPHRLFEFLAGTIAYLASKNSENRLHTFGVVQFVVCLTVIVGSAAFLDTGSTLPGFLSVPAVAATAYALCLRNVKLPKVIAGEPIKHIGDASYSIYLVHWPIICLASYVTYLNNSHKLAIFFASLILGYFSYWAIESRNSRSFSLSIPWRFTYIAIATSVLGLALIRPDVRQEAQKLLDAEAAAQIHKRYAGIGSACNLAKLEKGECETQLPNVLVMGDSHEPDGFEILASANTEEPSYQIVAFGLVQDCGFYFDTIVRVKNLQRKTCNARAEAFTRSLQHGLLNSIVVNVYKPLEWGRDVLSMVRDIKKRYPHLKVVIMTSYVGIRPYKCIELINRTGTAKRCVDPNVVSHFGAGEAALILEFFGDQQITIFDKVALLCTHDSPESCKYEVNGIPAFFDGDHLSVEFSRYIGSLVDPTLFYR